MKISIAAALTIAVAAPGVSAQPTEAEAIDRTIACRDIENDLDRLKCLDNAAETLAVTRIIREEEIAEKKQEERSLFGLGKPKDKSQEKREVVAETEEEFGGEYLPKNRLENDASRLKKISAKVAEIRVNRFGKVTLTLDNGQVWRQLDSDNKTIRFGKEDKLYTARVKRSTFGNYMLTIEELKRTIRVKRIE